MYYRRWLHHLAFGIGLTGFLLVAPALSQQDTKEPAAPINEGQGVTGEAPTPDNNGAKDTNGEQKPPENPVPESPPVESKPKAVPANDTSKKEAAEREKADLIVQQSMDVMVACEDGNESD
jgi:hypothetical protein